METESLVSNQIGCVVSGCVVETTVTGSVIVKCAGEMVRVAQNGPALHPGQFVSLKVISLFPVEYKLENIHGGYS